MLKRIQLSSQIDTGGEFEGYNLVSYKNSYLN